MTEIFLDPTAELSPTAKPLLPRLRTLEGKTIGLLDINKPRGDEFLDRTGLGGVTRICPGRWLERRENRLCLGSPATGAE